MRFSIARACPYVKNIGVVKTNDRVYLCILKNLLHRPKN